MLGDKRIAVIIGGLVFLSILTFANIKIAQQTTTSQSQAQSQPTRLYWSPSNITLAKNQNFTTDLILDPGSNSVSALDVIITYDPLQVKVQNSSFNQTGLDFPVQKSEAGKIVFSAIPKDFETNPTFAKTKLASFTFEAIGERGVSEISIDSSSIAAYAGKNLLTLDVDSKLKVKIE